MNPIFFGRDDHRLFGAYQSARRRGAGRGVVLCYPWGPEYLPAHKAFKSLASLLSEAGHDVLRFDYHGTGDSGGDFEEGTPPSWLDDLAMAIDELEESSGRDEVGLCGLRMGAGWAAQAAAKRPDVARFVAWDPVWDGQAYLRDLDRYTDAYGNTLEAQGFRLPPEARTQFAAVTPALYAGLRIPMLVVLTEGDAGVVPLTLGPVPGDGRVDIDVLPASPAWIEGELGTGGLPVAALRRIVHWLG